MSKLLNIITNPNDILRRKSENVEKSQITKEKMQELCSDMEKTMKQKDGIGLAAPQIEKNIRLVVINSKDGILTMFNPKITKKSFWKEWDIEGCLSVPNTFGQVRRNKKVTCYFLNKKGWDKKIEAEGLLARVIQHEIDHLDAILFIDKAKNIKKVKPEEEK